MPNTKTEFPICIDCKLPLDLCVCKDDPGGTDDEDYARSEAEIIDG